MVVRGYTAFVMQESISLCSVPSGYRSPFLMPIVMHGGNSRPRGL
jgi:hypothetical protein